MYVYVYVCMYGMYACMYVCVCVSLCVCVCVYVFEIQKNGIRYHLDAVYILNNTDMHVFMYAWMHILKVEERKPEDHTYLHTYIHTYIPTWESFRCWIHSQLHR